MARASTLAAGMAAVLVAGCAWMPAPAPQPRPAPPPAPPMTVPTPPSSSVPPQQARPQASARNWDEYRVQAARRMAQRNPDLVYLGVPPDPLLAIPVLEVELLADGSVANIRVQRQPTQATETVQLAIDAVRRSAPFGPVSHLPRPWRFTEVFLFDDSRRFKPRSLD